MTSTAFGMTGEAGTPRLSPSRKFTHLPSPPPSKSEFVLILAHSLEADDLGR